MWGKGTYIQRQEEGRKKTAFITKYGIFEHVRMGFGLCNGPATYAPVINLVLRRLNWKTVLAFLDDILVLGKDFKDHFWGKPDLDNLVFVSSLRNVCFSKGGWNS